MPSFHFSVGNSADGHIGLCARVAANTNKEAVKALKQFLEGLGEEVELHRQDQGSATALGVEYCNVYLNENAFKVGDIGDGDTMLTDEEVSDLEEPS